MDIADLEDIEREECLRTPHTYCDSLLFADLTDKLEKISKTGIVEEKLGFILSPELYQELHEKNESAYSIIRLVIPDADKSRYNYGLKVKKLATLYIKELGLSGLPEKRLKNFRDPTLHASSGLGVVVGDFSTILEDVLAPRCRKRSRDGFTVGDVNAELDKLAAAHSEAEKQQVISRFIKSCSAREHKWICRIIFKDMKMGLGKERFFSKFHPDAPSFYDHCRNLKLVCSKLRNPNERFCASLRVFQGCSPMLAKRLNSWKEVWNWFSLCKSSLKRRKKTATTPLYNGNASLCIEDKLDGDRILLHKKGDAVKLFTRNCIDYTNRYLKYMGGPAIKNVSCKECILDGEMLLWDDRNQRFNEFGFLSSFIEHKRKSTENKSKAEDKQIQRNGVLTNDMSEMWPCYVVFDILYVQHDGGKSHVNGNVMNEALATRKDLLSKLIRPIPNVFYTVPYKTLLSSQPNSWQDIILECMESVHLEKKEGLVLKNFGSPYILGESSRKKGYWVKLKPEYLGELSDSLDLLVLGGYYASGRRRSTLISHFLLGTRINTSVCNDSLEDGQFFHTVCKVGTGYSVSELQDWNQLLKKATFKTEHAASGKPIIPPHFSGWIPKKKDDVPDVWFQPTKSFVVEICGAELHNTDQFNAGITVRFPRVKTKRLDKNWYDAMTTPELSRRHTKLSHSNSQGEMSQSLPAADAGRTPPSSLTVSSSILNFDGDEHDMLSVPSNAPLSGKTFIVFISKATLNANAAKEVAHRVCALGGKTQANPPEQCPQNFFSIAAQIDSAKIKNFASGGKCDILTLAWLDEVERRSLWVNPYASPRDWLLSMRRDKERLYKDAYGDLYYHEGNAEELKTVFAQMDGAKSIPCGEDEKISDGIFIPHERTSNAQQWTSLYQALGDDPTAFDLLHRGTSGSFLGQYFFAKFVFFFEDLKMMESCTLVNIEMVGGNISTDPTDRGITHIVTPDNGGEETRSGTGYSSKIKDDAAVDSMLRRRKVPLSWVLKCLSMKQLVLV